MKNLCCIIAAVTFLSCERPLIGNADDGNVVIDVSPSTRDVTRNGVTIGDYFSKLNVQLFDQRGDKVLEKVKTQTRDDDEFGHLSLTLNEGTYTVVAVGHSSTKSATINSPEMVQFTASDGSKLTDTFCRSMVITVGNEPEYHILELNRAVAMIQFRLTDSHLPAVFDHLVIDYSGGSANVNPNTFEGTTKSSQSERREANTYGIYQVFTFPYQATSCTLKMTVTACDDKENIIRKRVFPEVPVTRNRITTYKGPFFEEGDGHFTVTDFGLTVNSDWDGEDTITF